VTRGCSFEVLIFSWLGSYMLFPVLDAGLDPGHELLEDSELVPGRWWVRKCLVEEITKQDMLHIILAEQGTLGKVQRVLKLKILATETGYAGPGRDGRTSRAGFGGSSHDG
jgi:hypothetical protein